MILFLFWFDLLNYILQFFLIFKNKIMLLLLIMVFENRQFLRVYAMPENRFSHFLKTSQSCNASHETQNSAKKECHFWHSVFLFYYAIASTCLAVKNAAVCINIFPVSIVSFPSSSVWCLPPRYFHTRILISDFSPLRT